MARGSRCDRLRVAMMMLAFGIVGNAYYAFETESLENPIMYFRYQSASKIGFYLRVSFITLRPDRAQAVPKINQTITKLSEKLLWR